MKFPGQDLLRQWRSLRQFHKLNQIQRSIVFYAENGNAWAHFQQMIGDLTEDGQAICYVTSDAQDPVLQRESDSFRTFYIGAGTVRTIFFGSLACDVCVMTMPELERFHIKRSSAQPVHYAYIFHSIVSTHMIYGPGAFNDYDSLFCVGPHHVREIRENEDLNKLKKKKIIEYGYPMLDSILRDQAQRGQQTTHDNDRKIRVLVAPSWGPHGVIESIGRQLVKILLGAGFQVTLRPHPMTRKKWPNTISDLEREFTEKGEFVVESQIASQESLHDSDIMISDWSGVAYEYAFGCGKPVLFIDLPRKVNNPDYELLASEPMEVTARDQVGHLVDPQNLDSIPAKVRQLCESPTLVSEQIREVAERHVFNLGKTSGGGDHIKRLVQEHCSRSDNTVDVP
ncbi:MAG: CDP-glycerol glycerophosphotransferase family protein [Pirellulales bacterium]